MQNEILNLLVKPWPRWMTKSRLARELGADDKEEVQRAITRLLAAGKLAQDGKGKGRCYSDVNEKPCGIPNEFVEKAHSFVLSNQLCSMAEIEAAMGLNNELTREVVNVALECGFITKHGRKRACRYYAGDFKPPNSEQQQAVKSEKKKAPSREPQRQRPVRKSPPASPALLPEDEDTEQIEIATEPENLRQHGDIKEAFAFGLTKMKKGGQYAKDCIDFSKKLLGKIGSGYSITEVQNHLYSELKAENLPHVMQNLGEGYRAYVWIPN